MPLFMIERRFAEQLEVDGDVVREVDAINAEEDVRWVLSFLTADKLRSYCLYEASSPDAILAAADRAGLPADVISQVDEIDPALLR
jgi:Nickel responsive protein SCO4226-like